MVKKFEDSPSPKRLADVSGQKVPKSDMCPIKAKQGKKEKAKLSHLPSAFCHLPSRAKPVKPLTVLMGVYNGETYLSEAIASILNQTFSDFDFLIINDASTDATGTILEKFAQQDSRIKIITNDQNYGLAYSLARGVEVAQTSWIARMDADDIAIRDRLAKQMKYLAENPEIDILGGYALNINEQGEILGTRKVPISNQKITQFIWTNPLIHPTVLFRRSAILNIGSYSDKVRKRIPEDYHLWFRACAAGLQFANLPEPLIYYRFSEENFVRNNLQFLLAHEFYFLNN